METSLLDEGQLTNEFDATHLLAAGLDPQRVSIVGHAKRNCASDAYEPPLRFGMIVSSKADTSSNST